MSVPTATKNISPLFWSLMDGKKLIIGAQVAKALFVLSSIKGR